MANYRKKQRNQNSAPEITYKINSEIEAKEIRVIDNEGKMVGVMSLKDALKLAVEQEMDLIEINPKANPPVVKMADYNKFKYQITKSTTKQKVKEDKSLRASVRVSESDLKVKANQAAGFLDKGHKVKLQVQMRGREKAYPEVAQEIMEQFISYIDTDFSYDAETKLTGDSVFAFLKPGKAK